VLPSLAAPVVSHCASCNCMLFEYGTECTMSIVVRNRYCMCLEVCNLNASSCVRDFAMLFHKNRTALNKTHLSAQHTRKQQEMLRNIHGAQLYHSS
jgi:hypothetical protein